MFFFLALLVSRSSADYVAECSGNEYLVVDRLEFTPCHQVQFTPECIAARKCVFPSLPTKQCADYWRSGINGVFTCSKTPNVLEPYLIQNDAHHALLHDIIPICDDTASATASALVAATSAGPKFAGQLSRPTIVEKQIWEAIGAQIKNENWLSLLNLTAAVGARVCRYSDPPILAILPFGQNKRTNNGAMILMRLSAMHSQRMIGLLGEHSNADDGTGEQAVRVFLQSGIFISIIVPWFRGSSTTPDPCKPDRLISDGAHSTENTFFRAVVGFADAFPSLQFIGLHRCGSCGAIRVGRAVNGRASLENSFVRNFIQAANDEIASKLSATAQSRGFYAAITRDAIAQAGASKWFKPTEGNNFFSRTNTPGRYLQGLTRICGGQDLSQSAEKDTSRYLHVEQVGGFSISNHQLWANAMRAMMFEIDVSNKSETKYPTRYPTRFPNLK